MNKEQYQAKKKELRDKISELQDEIKDLEQNYALEVMKRNAYKIGGTIYYRGAEFQITGGAIWCTRPIIVGNKLKKDGTLAKISTELHEIRLEEE